MAAIPQPQHTTVGAVYRALEAAQDDGNRPHLGASLIGDACERRLWYVFRWAETRRHDGRMLLLFGTGHREEERMLEELRLAGAEVHALDPATGKQFRAGAHGNHFGCSLDGVALKLPEAPKTWHLVEIKTHNQKSWDDLQKKGLKASKPKHQAQMIVGMQLHGLTRAYYYAKNKNTDERDGRRIEADPVEAARLLAKAERIIRAVEPPARCSADPSWYECKYCDYHAVCHGEQVPEPTCRSCAHATPAIDPAVSGDEGGRWTCAKWGGADIPLAEQRKGCTGHRYIPILLEKFATPADVIGDDVVYDSRTGGRFVNGEGPGAFSSQEISTCGGKAVLPDMAIVKAEVPGAKVVA